MLTFTTARVINGKPPNAVCWEIPLIYWKEMRNLNVGQNRTVTQAPKIQDLFSKSTESRDCCDRWFLRSTAPEICGSHKPYFHRYMFRLEIGSQCDFYDLRFMRLVILIIRDPYCSRIIRFMTHKSYDFYDSWFQWFMIAAIHYIYALWYRLNRDSCNW